MESILIGALGLLFGSLLGWLVLRSRTAATEARLTFSEKELTSLKAELARVIDERQQLIAARARLEAALESERKTSTEKIELLTSANQRAGEDLQNAFKA